MTDKQSILRNQSSPSTSSSPSSSCSVTSLSQRMTDMDSSPAPETVRVYLTVELSWHLILTWLSFFGKTYHFHTRFLWSRIVIHELVKPFPVLLSYCMIRAFMASFLLKNLGNWPNSFFLTKSVNSDVCPADKTCKSLWTTWTEPVCESLSLTWDSWRVLFFGFTFSFLGVCLERGVKDCHSLWVRRRLWLLWLLNSMLSHIHTYLSFIFFLN